VLFTTIDSGDALPLEGKVSVPRSVPFAAIIMCGCDEQVTSSSATIMASKPFAIILIFRFMVCSPSIVFAAGKMLLPLALSTVMA
jgi:hypothetical protein